MGLGKENESPLNISYIVKGELEFKAGGKIKESQIGYHYLTVYYGLPVMINNPSILNER